MSKALLKSEKSIYMELARVCIEEQLPQSRNIKNSAIRAILVQSDGPELKICRNLSVARLTNEQELS